MRYPGEILVQQKWITLFAALVVVVGIFAGANRKTYDYYMENAPDISWENIPESGLTIFLWNLRNALLSLFGIVLALWSGLGLGISIGVGLWLISQNLLYIANFSHGILELYSAFLAMVGGLLVLAKIGEAILGFFRFIPRYIDWKEVAEDYGSLFLFSVIGLFMSAWMEALLGYAAIRFGSSAWLVVVLNTVISLLIISSLSSNTIRALLTRKAELTTISIEATDKKIPAAELPDDVWCICPMCGAYISADIEYCTCGAKLPKRPPRGR